MSSKREHYMVRRYGRRYGPRGVRFMARAWQATNRYFCKEVWGDHCLSLLMDQIVRIQKLGDKVIEPEHRARCLESIWELVEKVMQHSENYGKDAAPEAMTGFSPEYTDYLTHVYDPKDTGDIHEIRVEPAYIPEEIAPIRHSQEAWEALLAELPENPEEVWQAVLVLWQLWHLRNGSDYLSWIN